MSPVTLRVRELREEAGLTQAELSAKTGLPIPAISRIENGHTEKIALHTIDRLCRVFDVDPGALFVRTRR